MKSIVLVKINIIQVIFLFFFFFEESYFFYLNEAVNYIRLRKSR